MDRFDPVLAADAALAEAAERRGVVCAPVGIDPHGSGADLRGHPHCASDVPGPYAGSEAELGVVGDPDGVGLVVKGQHGRDRPEHLLPGDPHLGLHGIEDRRLIEERFAWAEVFRLAAAMHELRSFPGGDLHVVSDLLQLDLRGDRADLGLPAERVTEPDPGATFDQPLDKRVMDRGFDHHPRAGYTGLARRRENAADNPLDRSVQVRICEDDVG